MKKKIAIIILITAGYVGISLLAGSYNKEKYQLQEKMSEQTVKLEEQVEKFEKQEKDFEKLEEKAKSYLKFSITDDCLLATGAENRGYCQCTVDFVVENNNAFDLINMDMGFDDEGLDEATDRAYEKCVYLSI